MAAFHRLTPHNLHPLPVAEAWDGTRWTVDLAYRTPHMDIETTASHQRLDAARNNAYSNIKRLITKR